MKTTIDIPLDVLRASMKFLSAASKREAVVGAMRDFNHRRQLEAFLADMSKSRTFMSQAQLKEMRQPKKTSKPAGRR